MNIQPNAMSFLLVPFAFCMVLLAGCFPNNSAKQPEAIASPAVNTNVTDDSSLSFLAPLENEQLLKESWIAYRRRFIQPDGRVIDWEADSRSTSEGQAYAMLRAVIINDPATFAKTLEWAENNLRRQKNGKNTDKLWAWKWGKDKSGKWGIIDANFASDADIDAITALIFAARRWNRPEYLNLAKAKLQDLWELSTIKLPSGKRYLLPGPKESFYMRSLLKLNPSYLAPYAFRLFAQVDPGHDWLSLVESSYQVLENSAQISAVKLPSDWVALDTNTGEYQAVPKSASIDSIYAFDAYRVWWRVWLDAAWFKSPEASQFLRQHLGHLQEQWRKQQKIPARINLQGEAIVDYEATSQYAMVYPALRQIDPTVAEQIRQRKLLPAYRNGIWDNDSAYYVQNLAWLGLLPPNAVTPQLLTVTNQQ
jgi:endoglucanase